MAIVESCGATVVLAEAQEMRVNDITASIIDAAIKVHSVLGPGLLEGAYVAALAIELQLRGMKVEREVPIRVFWEGQDIGIGYRADLVVDGLVIVECKAVEQLPKVAKRQLRTQVRLSGLQVGLLLNFGEELLKNGIVRHVENLTE